MDPVRRNQLLEDAFLRPPVEIRGYELRPLSAASFVILKRTGNPYAADLENAPRIDSPEGMLAVFAFIYVHAAPMAEVLRNHRDPEAFEDAVLTFAADFPADFVAQAVPVIAGEIEISAAAISESEPPEHGEEHDPNGRGRRGSRTASSPSRPKQKGRAAAGKT